MAGRSNLESIILYGGGFLLTYYVLKSWGIIATSKTTTPTITGYASTLDTPQFNWKPLSGNELNNLKVENLKVNPYADDKFDVRTGRDRNKKYGFVGN